MILPGKAIQIYSMYKHRVYKNGQFLKQEVILSKFMEPRVEVKPLIPPLEEGLE
jgi:hypothetical protein